MPEKSKETYNSKTGTCNTFRAAESSKMMVKGICDMQNISCAYVGLSGLGGYGS